MRLLYEKHVQYINLIELKHNSYIKQQRWYIKHYQLKLKKKDLNLSILFNSYSLQKGKLC